MNINSKLPTHKVGEDQNISEQEAKRLQALQSYSVLDTLPEADYDHITKLASQICGTPVSLITLLDSDRQWFKSCTGLEISETPRNVAFCAHAIEHKDELMEVLDARNDVRFCENPLVTNEPGIQYYAGVPLVNPEGHALGTLCVIDFEPRQLTGIQKESLRSLAKHVSILLELRRANLVLEQSKTALQERYHELEKFAYVVSHDLKSPLNNISSISESLIQSYGKDLDPTAVRMMGYLHESSETLRSLIDGILMYYKNDDLLSAQTTSFDISLLINQVINLYGQREHVFIQWNQQPAYIQTHRTALKQILINLVANAIKYNDKAECFIEIRFEKSPSHYTFSVKDNGRGIPETSFSRIFDLFETVDKPDNNKQMGTGIGLATVKKLVQNLGGKIDLESEIGIGTTFYFTIAR